MWEVEYTDEFGDWYGQLSEDDQDAVVARVELLEQLGPALGRPAVDNVHKSKHSNMKELRAERALRVLLRSILAAPPSCSSVATRARRALAHRTGTAGTTMTCRWPMTSTTTTCGNSRKRD